MTEDTECYMALIDEKRYLKKELQSFEKDFHRTNKRQVKSVTDIRAVAPQYLRYKKVKESIKSMMRRSQTRDCNTPSLPEVHVGVSVNEKDHQYEALMSQEKDCEDDDENECGNTFCYALLLTIIFTLFLHRTIFCCSHKTNVEISKSSAMISKQIEPVSENLFISYLWYPTLDTSTLVTSEQHISLYYWNGGKALVKEEIITVTPIVSFQSKRKESRYGLTSPNLRKGSDTRLVTKNGISKRPIDVATAKANFDSSLVDDKYFSKFHTDPSYLNHRKYVPLLTPTMMEEVKKSKTSVMVYYYAPDNPKSKSFYPVWVEFAKAASRSNYIVTVAAFETTSEDYIAIFQEPDYEKKIVEARDLLGLINYVETLSSTELLSDNKSHDDENETDPYNKEQGKIHYKANTIKTESYDRYYYTENEMNLNSMHVKHDVSSSSRKEDVATVEDLSIKDIEYEKYYDGKKVSLFDVKEEYYSDPEYINKKQYVKWLTKDTFQEFLEENENAFVNYYSPACIWSSRLFPVWLDFAEEVSSSKLKVAVGAVDCSKEEELCYYNSIHSFPTLRWYERNAHYASDYKDVRTVRGLINYSIDELTLANFSNLLTGKLSDLAAS